MAPRPWSKNAGDHLSQNLHHAVGHDHVDRQLTLRYERKRITLEQNGITRGLVGKYVETYTFADGRLDIRWKGLTLPYRAFDHNQQHVTGAAITENKRQRTNG